MHTRSEIGPLFKRLYRGVEVDQAAPPHPELTAGIKTALLLIARLSLFLSLMF